jgi:hypothetical protein
VSAVDTLRAATPTRKTVTMCMDGALQAEWERATEELDEAARNDARSSLADLPATTAVVDRLDEMRDRVQASEVTFLFERLGPWEDIALRADHPPREGNPVDRIRGFNIETFFPALVRASCVSVTGKDSPEPEAVPDDVWEALLGSPATEDQPARRGSLNTKQVNQLIAAAEYVNNGETTVPPSARSLLESQDFGASLAQPSPGTALPRNGSAGGKRPTSPSTSTTKKVRSKGSSSGR